MSAGPIPPPPPPIDPPQIDPAIAFALLDPELPLALFPVRLEARFLPENQPTEIVVRVFPDDIHVDAHELELTAAEIELARAYWETIWRGAAAEGVVTEAREWLAAELGANRAIYVARKSQPEGMPPTKPTPAGQRLRPPLELPTLTPREASSPGRARLMPGRWCAYVEVEDDKRGPFWGAYPVQADLAASPALVELREGDDSRGFLDAQGLRWAHDLTAAEQAGMVIRIPIAQLPPRPSEGYHRLIVFGAWSATDQHEVVRNLLDAQRYTRGFDFLRPGTATNTTEQSPDSAGRVSVHALFETEFALSKEEDKPQPRTIHNAPELFVAKPEDALATALGLVGQTAADRAPNASHPAADLAHAANQALWPATLGNYLTDPFRRVENDQPVPPPDDIDFVREWFTDYVRSEGPLPTLRVGRQPYGLLPIREFLEVDGPTRVEYLEGFLFDLFANWYNFDGVPTLDPDAADRTPPPRQAAEQASDIGEIYGATPHVHQIRLRPVDDAYRDLSEGYDVRVSVLGALCALVPKQVIRNSDGSIDFLYADPDELDQHPWYQPFAEHENAARNGPTAQAQIDALTTIRDELEATPGSDVLQDVAAFVAIKWIDKNRKHFHDGDPNWPDDDSIPTGDVLGFAFRHQARVENAQPRLVPLGIRSFLGAERAPRLYSAGFHEAGSEVEVEVLVSETTDEAAVDAVASWLTELRDAAQARADGGHAPDYAVEKPKPFLQQLLQLAVVTVTGGGHAAALRDGIDRLVSLVEDEGAAAIVELERLLRSTLGLALYRVDAWITSLASRRLAELRLGRPSGLQTGGYGWLVNLSPRRGKASQGHIHAPSLDHAVTAAVLRSGWSAFGTAESGSPLAVNLSSERVRAAKTIIEAVRAGQELGRLIGGRVERRLHDANLDQYIDDVRSAVLEGAGHKDRPPTRLVDGLLLARAFTDGIEQTEAERAVRTKVDETLAGVDHERRVRDAINGAIADLDAVADVLFSQAVHALLRGDAGVTASTLAATGSGDSGLPAIDFPKTLRGGRLVTLRIVAVFGADLGDGAGWPGASRSVRAAAEPRLERWVGRVLGPPSKVIIDVKAGGVTRRFKFAEHAAGALDALYGVDTLGETILANLGLDGAEIVPGRPRDLGHDQISFDELVTLARSSRAAVGRIRALTDADFETEEAGPRTWDAADLQGRLAAARALVPADDLRLAQLAAHELEHPGATADQLIERLHILTVDPVPILPLLVSGVPAAVQQSFRARGGAGAAGWFAQAAKTRNATADLADAVQMAELVQDRTLLRFALAQTSDAPGRPWAGFAKPAGSTSHTCWCSLTGDPPAGSVAGFVVDSWTETVPETQTTTGVAVHFDGPSATAPHAVLLLVTRDDQRFSLDHVSRCLTQTLKMTHFRALGPDNEHAFMSQFLPAVILPGELEVMEKET